MNYSTVRLIRSYKSIGYEFPIFYSWPGANDPVELILRGIFLYGTLFWSLCFLLTMIKIVRICVGLALFHFNINLLSCKSQQYDQQQLNMLLTLSRLHHFGHAILLVLLDRHHTWCHQVPSEPILAL